MFFCFVLVFLQNVQFPHHNLGSGWFFFFFFFFFVSPVDKVIYFLLFLFVCFSLFYFILFFCCCCFCFQKFHPPWYQMVRPYPYSITQMMVDITSSTILNYRAIQWKIYFQSETSNTFIQECKKIWEFQIRWGGTPLLRPLWRSWRYLKAYTLMSNTGRFQNFKNLIFFWFCFCIFP